MSQLGLFDAPEPTQDPTGIVREWTHERARRCRRLADIVVKGSYPSQRMRESYLLEAELIEARLRAT